MSAAINTLVDVIEASFKKCESGRNDFEPGRITTATVEFKNAVSDLRAALAAKTEGVDDQDRAYTAIRLRAVCNILGLAGAVPEKDGELLGSMFSVLGMVRRKIEELKAVAIGFTTFAPAMAVAPWPDFLGQTIAHGCRLLHPADGAEFTAIRLHGHADEVDSWRAVYDDGTVSRLCLQIGDKGQAVLSTAPAVQQGGDDALMNAFRCAKLSHEDYLRVKAYLPYQPAAAHPLMGGKSGDGGGNG